MFMSLSAGRRHHGFCSLIWDFDDRIVLIPGITLLLKS